MTKNKIDCPVFVITLDYAQERREIISARLRELSLSCKFIPGVDGRKLDLLSHPAYEPVKRRLFFGRDLSAGEFGCVLAHRNVYQYMADNHILRALVLEDDATLADALPTVIKALCNIPATWDLIRFLGRQKNYRSQRSILPLEKTGSMLSRQHGTHGGAYGYMINLEAAKRLLSMMQKNWMAIDTLHGVTWLTRLKTFSVMPSPVLPNDDVPSCIDEQDANKRWDKSVRMAKWQRPLYPFTRGLWKLYLNCAVKIVWFGSWPSDARLRRRSTGSQRSRR